MPNKRSSKTKDINQIATELLEEAVGEPAPITSVGKKNPAAADAARVRNSKAGASSAKGLSPRKRKS